MPPAARRVRVRSYDPARTRAALRAQAQALSAAVQDLCARPDAGDLLAAPVRPGDRTVRELVADLGAALDELTGNLGLPPGDAAPLTPTDWVTAARTPADPAAVTAPEQVAAAPEQVAAGLDAAVGRLGRLLAEEHAGELRLPTPFGPMLLSDYLVTRLLETVVHADDLAGALAAAAPGDFAAAERFPHDRQALAAATRLLADGLAVSAPGGAVELRIPPFAVVQCVQGPRHTRGTPPSVVETDPLTWIRLATGRTSWARAAGLDGDVAQLTAGGERSDLSSLLPVIGRVRSA